MLAIALVIAAAMIVLGTTNPTKDLIFGKVLRQPVTVTVSERGTLDSQSNVDVVCRVKSGSKNSTVSTTIKRLLVDDGQKVHGPPRKQIAATSVGLGFSPYGFSALTAIGPQLVPGELLIELDSSGLEDQLKTQNITRDNAKLEWDKAESDLIIVFNQNDSDTQKAITDLKLAELDLKKYKEAEYPAKLEDINNKLSQAEDRVNYSQRMVKKEFMSPSQLQADQFAYLKSKLDKQTLGYEYQLEVTKRQSVLDEARRQLARVEETTRSKLNTARKTSDSKRGVYEQEQRRCDEIKEEIKKCRVYADQSGMVIYVVPEQARFGGGSQQSIVAQGEPVREGQKLLKIPDLSKMQVTTKVHEALVSSVHLGQKASIRLDAFTGKVLHGKVVSVATVDSKQDWMQADVKVYQTTINIDPEDTLTGLKPGMSADVSIEIDRAHGKVLTIPVEAIVDSMEDGVDPTCFVRSKGGDVQKRSIKVGISNGKVAEVKEGLEEGDEIVLNPGKLLTESEKKNLTKTASEEQRTKRGPGDGKPKDKPAVAPKPLGPTGPASGVGPGPKGPPVIGGPNAAPSAGQGQPDAAKMQQQRTEAFKKMTPAQRKEALMLIPAQFREQAKSRLKAQGLEIAD